MTEHNRVWKEFQKLYQLRPELNVRANDKFFLDYAKQSGGTEAFDAEAAILWLDDPALRQQLVVLTETPDQAFARFFGAYPAFDFTANRGVLEAYIKTHSGVVTFDALKDAARNVELAIDQDVVDRQMAQRENEEREQLIDIVVLDHSKGAYAQEIQRGRCRFYSLDQLRDMVANIRERRELARLSPAELRARIKQTQSDNAPAPKQLPANITKLQLVQMAAPELRRLVELYGQDAVNYRLGYVRPKIGGRVREINLGL